MFEAISKDKYLLLDMVEFTLAAKPESTSLADVQKILTLRITEWLQANNTGNPGGEK